MEEQHSFDISLPIARDTSRRSSRPLSSRGALGLCFLLLSSLTGCATVYGNKNFYSAHDLPLNSPLHASATSNPQTLDLTKLAVASGTTNEVLGVGDVLDVSVSAGPGHRDQWSLRVENQGTINIPYGIGPIPVAGQAPEEVEAQITQAGMQRGVYRAPAVNVSVKRKRMITVTVLGAVNSPGVKSLPPNNTDLLSILVAAGGLAKDAGTNVEIQNVIDMSQRNQESIARGGVPGVITPTGYASGGGAPKSVRVDLVSAATKGTNGYYVGDGGVVMVEKRDLKDVSVSGLVRKPGPIEFPQGKDFYLLDALTSAGWVSTQVADKVYVIRQAPGDTGTPSVIQCSIARAKHDPSHNLRLAPGDIVTVEHSPLTVVMEALNIIRVGFNLTPLL